MKLNDEMRLILQYNLNLLQKKEIELNADKKTSVEKLIKIYKNLLTDPAPTKAMITKNVVALEQLANCPEEPSYWEAMSLCGFCYHEGFGIAKDLTKAFLHWDKAAKEGKVMSAQFWLSQSKVLRHKNELPRFDKKEEQELLKVAVGNKYAPAMVKYAKNIQKKISFHPKKIGRQKFTEQNGNLEQERKKVQERSIQDANSLDREWLEVYKEPIELYEQAAALHYSDGLFQLGFLYTYCRVLNPQQRKIGWAYLETAAEQYNHANSLNFLANFCNRIAGDFDKIYHALENNQKENILKLTPKDLVDIAFLQEFSFEARLKNGVQENANQENQELSPIQLLNRTLKKEEISNKAFELYLRSAKLYNTDAMHMLYLAFKSKMGDESRKWLELSANLGNDSSRTTLAKSLLKSGDDEEDEEDVKVGREMLISLSQNRKNTDAQFVLAKLYIEEIKNSGIKVQDMMISFKARQVITMLSYCEIADPLMVSVYLEFLYRGRWHAFNRDSERASIMKLRTLLIVRSRMKLDDQSKAEIEASFLSIMPEVRKHLPLGVPGEFDEILDKYKLVAKAGNARASSMLGFIHQCKLGTEMRSMETNDRIVTAIDWYFKALEDLDDKEYSCLSDLWICCQWLIDDDFDMAQEKVKSLMTLCHKYTDPKLTKEIPTYIKKEAWLILAEIFEQGIFLDFNLREAIQCYEKAQELDIHDIDLMSKIAEITSSIPIFTAFQSYRDRLFLAVRDTTGLPNVAAGLVLEYAIDHRDSSLERNKNSCK